MGRKLNLAKGQDVIIRYINDRIRYKKDVSISNIDEWTTKGIVTKIGRKYIEVNMNGFLVKFDIEFDYRQKSNMASPAYKLYLSKEEITNEIKAEEMYRKLNSHFVECINNNGKFTLDQLERILSIVNENS